MFRSILYICIFTTGLVSLIYQVIWQRYLAILLGSEAKSASLVVAVFLFGLALGYYLFGRLTEKIDDRSRLLKIYGWIEIITAAYAIIFPSLFIPLMDLSFSGPNNLFFDLIVTLLALLGPTILMGATVPIMTTVIPKLPSEVNDCHAKIYGWNTFGAFLGTLVGGIYIVPKFGLPSSLYIAGTLNLIVGIIYGLNRLEGKALKSDDFGKPQAHLANWFLYSFIFAVGLVTISLEIILVRLVSLTIGSGVYVFPIVLGIVVLGIALGSLSIHNREIKTHTLLHRSLIGAGLLIFAFVTVPYWPTLVSHIRVSLVSIPSNHFVFLTFVFALLSIFLFLPFYFMGQLLPLSYAYIEKDKNNYGRICGNLYFFNTIGTVVGAVVIGYWLLHFLSTQQVFALDILLVIALAFIVAYLQKRYIYLVVSACLAIFLLTWPDWNRIHHEFGIFRMRTLTTSHFTGNLLFDAGPIGETLLFEDGPNSTVTIADHTPTGIEPTPKNEIVLPGPKYREISVVMNGKSDGDSHVDFGTMYMTALLPYIYADHKPNLKVAIAGFGLGITAGALARAKDVGSVEVVEISSVLSQHHALLDPVNFNFSQNNKAKIITNDAFRYLMRSKDKFDIIASEPSNPWVVGVENLFSLDFYEVAASKLNNGGLIAQWINSYDTSNEIIRMIFANLTQVFPFVRSYKVGLDFIILGSKLPFSDSALEERLQEDFFKTINQKIGFDSFAGIRALEVTNESASAFLTLRNELGFHSLQFPKLAFGSNRAFFLNERAIDDKLIDNFSSSRLLYSPNKESVLTYLQQNPLCDKANFYKMMCMQYQKIVKRYKAYRSPTSGAKALESYLWLRHFGYIDKDSEFLALLEKHLFSNPEVSEKAASLLFSAFIEDENFTRAHELVSQLKIRNQIGELEVQKFEEDLVKTKKFQEQSKNIIQGIQANLSKLNEASKSTKRVEL